MRGSYTTSTKDDMSESGRMVEFHVNSCKEWSLGREEYTTRLRPQVLTDIVLLGEDLTLVLTPC